MYEEIFPILTLISFIIGISVIVYQFGKWRQKNDAEREELKTKINLISERIEKIPAEFWSKFIDAYEMLEKFDDQQKNKKERTKNDE
jgi:hypothetical protein